MTKSKLFLTPGLVLGVLALALLAGIAGARAAQPPAIDGRLDATDCDDLDGLGFGGEPDATFATRSQAILEAARVGVDAGRRLVVHPSGEWTVLDDEGREVAIFRAVETRDGWAAQVGASCS